jgi:hypothetical protein
MGTGLEILAGVVGAIDTLEKNYAYAGWALECYQNFKHSPDVRQVQEFLDAVLDEGHNAS